MFDDAKPPEAGEQGCTIYGGNNMFSIQWYDVEEQNKIGTPEGVFYTEDKARETAINDELMRSFQDYPPRHFKIVPA